MPELKYLLDALTTASKSALGIIGYFSTLVVWLLIVWRVSRHETLLRHIQKLPAKDRLEAFRMELGYVPAEGLTAEQWIRSRIHQFWFIGLIVAFVCVTFILIVGLSKTDQVRPQGQNAQSSEPELYQKTPNVRITYLRFENTILLERLLNGFGFSPSEGFLVKPFWLKNSVYKELASILSGVADRPTARRTFDILTLAEEDGHGNQLWFLDSSDGKITSPLVNAAKGEKALQQIYPVALPLRGPDFVGPQNIDELLSKASSDPYWQINLVGDRSNSDPVPFDGYEVFGFPDSQTVIPLLKDPISREILNANPERRDIVALVTHCIHGEYHGEIWIREIKLLAVDIENTGERPIGLYALKETITGSAGLYKVRPLDENQSVLAASELREQTLPLEALRPGEHLIVPLQIELGLADPIHNHPNWNYERYLNEEFLPKKWWLNRTEPEISFQVLRSTDNVGNPNIDIRRISLSELAGKPDLTNLLTPTYVIGQSIDVRQVVFRTGNGTLAPQDVRKFDPNNLLVRGAYEAGSCPILFWKQARQKEWSRFGRILINAVTSQRRMTESIPVEPTAAVFKLSEQEDESSFIENVRLVISDDDGQTHTYSPVRGKLDYARQPGILRLDSGEQLEFTFDIPETLRRSRRKLVVTGYYVPRTLMSK